jgi:hypothetical protein
MAHEPIVRAYSPIALACTALSAPTLESTEHRAAMRTSSATSVARLGTADKFGHDLAIVPGTLGSSPTSNSEGRRRSRESGTRPGWRAMRVTAP